MTLNDVDDFDENDATYVERNVLQEESASVLNETISVEKLRQRFDSDRRVNEDKPRKASNPRPPIKAKPVLSSFSSFEVSALKLLFPETISSGLELERAWVFQDLADLKIRKSCSVELEPV